MIKRVLLVFFAMVLTMSGAGAKEYAQRAETESGIPTLDCVIEPSEIVDVGSAVHGVVETIYAYRSDLVKKDAVVAELESTVEEANLELATTRAGLNTAIKLRQESAALGYLTQKRNQALFKKSAISKQDMDQLKTETRIASLQVRQEKENKRIASLEAKRASAMLQRRSIKSPVEGVVMERFKSAGEYVEGEPILRIAQLDPLHVEVIVPVDYLGQVIPGMQAQITPTAGASGTHLATVERVDRVADAASGTYGVRLSLPNPENKIPAGLRCQVGFLSTENIDSLKLVDEVSSSNGVKVSDAANTNKDTASIGQPSPLLKISTSEPARQVSQITPASCYSVGPVKTEKLAQQLSNKLENYSDNLNLRNESGNRNKGFVVLVAQGADKKSPRSLEILLGKAGISDRYVISKGKNKGRVSAGTYYSQQSAIKRQKQLAANGFDTEIIPLRKKFTQYWLDVSAKSGADIKGKIKKVSSTFGRSVNVKPMVCS